MSTYGGLTVKDGHRVSKRVFQKDGETQEKTFQYTEPFSNHFDFRHIVDDHNHIRHMFPSIEEIWTTHRWATRVFTFLLAISEVNTYLAFRFFIWQGKERLDWMDFRSKFAWALIDNPYLVPESSDNKSRTRKRKATAHSLVSAPPHASKYDGSKWIKSAKFRYQQYTCQALGCKKAIRTYCVCSVGSWLC